jgi:hypothetical protein
MAFFIGIGAALGIPRSSPPERKLTENYVRNEITQKVSVANNNIINAMNQITNDVTTNIDQIIKADSTQTVTAANIYTYTGDKVDNVVLDISQDGRVQARNNSIQKLQTDITAFQQFSTELVQKMTNKIKSDAQLEQDAKILNTFKDKMEKQEGLASIVGKITDGIFGSTGSVESAKNTAITIFNQEVTITNNNSIDLSTKVENIVKTALKQDVLANCISTTSGLNYAKINIKQLTNSVIKVKQDLNIMAFNTCVQDLKVGIKVVTDIVGKSTFEAIQEIDNQLSAKQKGEVKNEFSKEVKITDAIADIFKGLTDMFGGIMQIIVIAAVGIGGVILLVVLIPMLKGDRSAPQYGPPPDYYGGYTDTFIDSITSVGNNLVAGGQNGIFDIANIYFICIFVIIFFVVKKYIPEC